MIKKLWRIYRLNRARRQRQSKQREARINAEWQKVGEELGEEVRLRKLDFKIKAEQGRLPEITRHQTWPAD